jgi:hypothetical protein
VRERDLVTTLFETFGLLLIIGGISAGVSERSVPAALILAGVGLLAASWLIVRAAAVAQSGEPE